MFPLNEYEKRLDELTQENNEEAVNFFANSDLPNSYFLQQFFEPYPKPFSTKWLWPGFAEVLIKRGIGKLDDVKVDIFMWLQDTNWPGCRPIVHFIRQNFSYFKMPIIDALNRALDDLDEAWFLDLIWQFCFWTEENDREIVEETKKMYNQYQENKSIDARKKTIDFANSIYDDFQKKYVHE